MGYLIRDCGVRFAYLIGNDQPSLWVIDPRLIIWFEQSWPQALGMDLVARLGLGIHQCDG